MLALTGWPMGVLTPIIEIAALTVLYARENLALGRAIAFEFIGDDHAWHVLQALEQLAEELLRRVLIPTVCPSVASRNLLLYQSLPVSIPDGYALVRRRNDDTGVGAALGRTAM